MGLKVYTGGTFDLLHAGHIDFLTACKIIAGKHGKVIVGLNTDEFVARFKGNKPVCSYEEREVVLQACRYVDKVVKNTGNEDSKITLNELGTDIDVILIGDDWAGKDYYKQMSFTPEWLEERHIRLLYVPRTRKISSTMLKGRTNEQLGISSLSTESLGDTVATTRVDKASKGTSDSNSNRATSDCHPRFGPSFNAGGKL